MTDAGVERFVEAQDRVWETVRFELRAGRKQSHWMWFVFPQIAGLGHSATARYYAIANLDEARAYLRHPVLGPRLAECTRLVNAVEGTTIEAIFGYPDYLKFHSSMTLFAAADPANEFFPTALAKYFEGRRDEATLSRL
ncbi:MAG: DUF1810 domain-containing protein [Bryobacteraceae bacterium]